MWYHEVGSILSKWTMSTKTGYQTANKSLDKMPGIGSQLWGWYARSLISYVWSIRHDVNLPTNRLVICIWFYDAIE